MRVEFQDFDVATGKYKMTSQIKIDQPPSPSSRVLVCVGPEEGITLQAVQYLQMARGEKTLRQAWLEFRTYEKGDKVDCVVFRTLEDKECRRPAAKFIIDLRKGSVAKSK